MVRQLIAAAVVALLLSGSAVVAERRGWHAPVVAMNTAIARSAQTTLEPSTPAPPPTATPTPVPVAPTPLPVAVRTPPPPTPAPLQPPDEPAEQPGTEVPTGPSQRTVHHTGHMPFATVAGIDLHHPTDRVERIGFHQSNHEGARNLDVYDTAAAPMVLESRERLSGERSAADVVVDPGEMILAPVTGTVVRGGVYTLYCDITDEFLVVAPDVQPSWEVKVLHVVGLRVSVGDHLQAGVTPIADRAHLLPFDSQVDAWTAEPSWPHTHIEVVDPSIPNQPNGGSGSEDCP